MQVLIVEGHQPLAELLHETLSISARHYQVEVVSSGHEAVQAAKDQCPDVVIIDVHLPGERGLEVVSLLLQSQAQPKIILLLEYDDQRYHRAACARGVSASLSKDRLVTGLPALVDELLAST